jgi:hypothetical protein
MELSFVVLVQGDPDVVAGEQVLTLGAESHFAQRPPVLQGVADLKEPQFTSSGLGERYHWHLGDDFS